MLVQRINKRKYKKTWTPEVLPLQSTFFIGASSISNFIESRASVTEETSDTMRKGKELMLSVWTNDFDIFSGSFF